MTRWLKEWALFGLAACFIVMVLALLVVGVMSYNEDFEQCKADGYREYECRAMLRTGWVWTTRRGR